jgi:FkbM family methyltransferase
MSKRFGRMAAGLARLATAPLHPWRRAQALAFAAQAITPHWTAQTSAGPLVFSGASGRALQDANSFTREEPETVAWLESLPRDAVFWDIGANVGFCAIFAAKRGISVLAFEPAASTLAVLTRNIELNGVSDRVRAYGVALADQTRLDVLHMAAERTEAGHALHSFGTRQTVMGAIEAGFQQAAIGYSADDFVAQFGAPAPTHIKLDVDGIETAILSGARGLLARSVQALMVEIYDDENPAQANAIRTAMAQAGFNEQATAFPAGRNKLFVRARGQT